MKKNQNNQFIAGSYKKHFYGKEYEYRSFVPSPVNQPYEWKDKRIPVLLEEAVRLVGELNAYSARIANFDEITKRGARNSTFRCSR